MMQSLEATCEEANRLLQIANNAPQTVPRTQNNSGKAFFSIHDKLREIYEEECANDLQQENKHLKSCSFLLEKLVAKEQLNTLIINLYPGNKGYSAALRIHPKTAAIAASSSPSTSAGPSSVNNMPPATESVVETSRWPYHADELLTYIDNEELPVHLVDLLETTHSDLFYSGCIIAEIRDYRHAVPGPNFVCNTHHVLLRPTNQSLVTDLNSLLADGEWSREDKLALESQLVLATQGPVCTDPSPANFLVENWMQYHRQPLNTDCVKRCARRFSQASVNRKRKLEQLSSAPQQPVLDFVNRRRVKARNSIATTGVKLPKKVCDGNLPPPVAAPVSLEEDPPEIKLPEGGVDVLRYAKSYDRPRETSDVTPQLVEEYILETEHAHGKIYYIKLSVLQRLSNSEYIGELYVDRNYVVGERNGASCRFVLGSRAFANKYIQQFTEIFTEEGRKSVRITHIVPGQPVRVRCTAGMVERDAKAAAAVFAQQRQARALAQAQAQAQAQVQVQTQTQVQVQPQAQVQAPAAAVGAGIPLSSPAHPVLSSSQQQPHQEQQQQQQHQQLQLLLQQSQQQPQTQVQNQVQVPAVPSHACLTSLLQQHHQPQHHHHQQQQQLPQQQEREQQRNQEENHLLTDNPEISALVTSLMNSADQYEQQQQQQQQQAAANAAAAAAVAAAAAAASSSTVVSAVATPNAVPGQATTNNAAILSLLNSNSLTNSQQLINSSVASSGVQQHKILTSSPGKMTLANLLNSRRINHNNIVNSGGVSLANVVEQNSAVIAQHQMQVTQTQVQPQQQQQQLQVKSSLPPSLGSPTTSQQPQDFALGNSGGYATTFTSVPINTAGNVGTSKTTPQQQAVTVNHSSRILGTTSVPAVAATRRLSGQLPNADTSSSGSASSASVSAPSLQALLAGTPCAEKPSPNITVSLLEKINASTPGSLPPSSPQTPQSPYTPLPTSSPSALHFTSPPPKIQQQQQQFLAQSPSPKTPSQTLQYSSPSPKTPATPSPLSSPPQPNVISLASLQGAVANIPGLQNVQVTIPGLPAPISLSLNVSTPSAQSGSVIVTTLPITTATATCTSITTMLSSSAVNASNAVGSASTNSSVVLNSPTNTGPVLSLPVAQIMASGVKNLSQQNLRTTTSSGSVALTQGAGQAAIQLVGIQRPRNVPGAQLNATNKQQLAARGLLNAQRHTLKVATSNAGVGHIASASLAGATVPANQVVTITAQQQLQFALQKQHIQLLGQAQQKPAALAGRHRRKSNAADPNK